MTTSPLNDAVQTRWSDKVAFAILVLVALIAALTFRDYGLGWDDFTHAQYGDLLLSLYGSGFRDTRALSFVNLYLYGGGFDMAAALLAKILPFDLFETRRLFGAAVGLVGLAATWRIGRRIGGPLAGLIALVLLATCPLYYGHMFINPKDAPFAAAMAIFLLGLVRAAGTISQARAFNACCWSALALASRSARASWRASACSMRSARSRCCLRSRRGCDGARPRGRAARPAAARADPERHPRLCADGAALAVVGGQSAQSGACHRDLLAFLRKAVARAVRRRADRTDRHAAQLRADPVRPEAAGIVRWACHARGCMGALVASARPTVEPQRRARSFCAWRSPRSCRLPSR